MATPVWTTTAGKLATFAEDSSYSLQLEANTSDSTAITYSVIAGGLPSGMRVTSSGLLTGTPASVAKRTLYTFVVRATSGSTVTDRTFSIDVEGQDAPTFTTASGQLELDDSTRVGLYWVLDGEYVNFQFQATDIDKRVGGELTFEVVSGILPPGLTLRKDGLLSGTCKLTDDYFEDSTRQIAMTFPITVRVSDSTSVTTQENSIYVYSAAYWNVNNPNITIDMTAINGFPITMDHTSQRRPVFLTDRDLGTFRHDNQMVIKIDVDDADSTGNDLVYTLQGGTLPTGLQVDPNSGEIFGFLPRQGEVKKDYSFTIRATRTMDTGQAVFTDQVFIMSVLGDIDIGVSFTTPTNVGTLTADIPSTLSIEAEADEPNRVLSYSVTGGALPTGITLSPLGNLVGTIDPSDFTDSTRTFTFTATVSDQYQESAASKQFTLTIDIPYTSIEYGDMTGHATSFIDQNIFYNIAQNPNINSPEEIYRPEDTNFGIKLVPEMLMMAGIEAQTLTTFQNQMELNHAPISLYFGELKTAVAKQSGAVLYEVVYIEMVDPFVNNEGVETGATTIRPNAVENMRDRLKALGHDEWTYLPLWMKTQQAGQQGPLGYVKAVPILYCKPGTSAKFKKRIDDLNLDFKKIDFIIDRYTVSKSKVSPNTFTGDGSTLSFELNELVHEEDILVKVGSTTQTRDDTGDGTDYHLTHDVANQKTTIVFNVASMPADGDVISVERLNDKYLRFRDIT
ncbi:MAG: putative Ig domain-containing protein [Rhodospirillales bacterium]